MKKWRTATIVPSFSGGKDSTYLVLRLHELGVKMADIVYFDTGWEFSEMDAHISQVEDLIKQKITRLVPRESFDYLFARKSAHETPQTSAGVTAGLRQCGAGVREKRLVPSTPTPIL